MFESVHKAAVFREVSLLIGGAKLPDWGARPPLKIRLRFKNFDDLGFRLGLCLLSYKGYGSAWVQ